MGKIVLRAVKGSDISAAENDVNHNAAAGINVVDATTALDISLIHQNATVEMTSSSAKAISIDSISSIITAADTTDFKFAVHNSGSGTCTITADTGTDTINGGTTSTTVILLEDEFVTFQTADNSGEWNVIADGFSKQADVVTTRGDVIRGSSTGVAERLAVGASGQYLTNDGTDVSWGTPTQQATQAAIEAETNEDTYLPPDLVKHSPGVAKGWAKFQIDGTVDASYNLTDIDDDGTGNFGVNWATDFSSVDYSVVAMTLGIEADHTAVLCNGQAAGATELIVFNSGGATVDPNAGVYIVAFGDQ